MSARRRRARRTRRIYDCVLYNGELDLLVARLHELQDVVDVFVIVESTRTSDGSEKPLHLREHWEFVRPFARKIRYIVVADDLDAIPPPGRERNQRNGLVRGLVDARRRDLVCLSDVGVIPSPTVLATWRLDPPRCVHFALEPSSRLRRIRGLTGRTRPVRSIGFRRSALQRYTPDDLLRGIQDGSIAARTIPKAGKSTHTPVRRRPARADERDREPVIVCPYLYDQDKKRVIDAFGLATAPGSQLPFFFWQDEARIGPERAFEHCWSQFPDRDVIIVHTDMRPMPNQTGAQWYQQFRAAVAALPGAAIVACDLLFPDQGPNGEWYIQSAGGFFGDGKFEHIGGRDSTAGIPRQSGIIYTDAYLYPRPTSWVTFGGVYIRRETIDMIGGFDRRYEWAYVMDVDYCAEAAMRGLTMVQVPVNLLHEENGTTGKFLADAAYRAKMYGNFDRFYAKWERSRILSAARPGGFPSNPPALRDLEARHPALTPAGGRHPVGKDSGVANLPCHLTNHRPSPFHSDA